jgi:hypothetical protein
MAATALRITYRGERPGDEFVCPDGLRLLDHVGALKGELPAEKSFLSFDLEPAKVRLGGGDAPALKTFDKNDGRPRDIYIASAKAAAGAALSFLVGRGAGRGLARVCDLEAASYGGLTHGPGGLTAEFAAFVGGGHILFRDGESLAEYRYYPAGAFVKPEGILFPEPVIREHILEPKGSRAKAYYRAGGGRIAEEDLPRTG